MIKKTAIAFATSILLGAGASLTASLLLRLMRPLRQNKSSRSPILRFSLPAVRSRAAVPARFRLRIMVLVPATNQSVLKF